MPSFPDKRDLARLAIQKAADHVAASKLLEASGFHDFAMFHLLTAIEEVAKARLVGESYTQLMRTLTGESDAEVTRRIGRVVRKHSIKIPVGLLAIIVQLPYLEIGRRLVEGRPISSEEAAAINKQNLEDARFIAEIFSDGFGIRNQSIYSGLDESDKIPQPFDWKMAVERVTPLLEDLIEFSRWAIEQKMSPEEAEKIRADLEKLAKRRNQPSNS